MSLTLFSIVMLVIFFISLIPYWKDMPYFIAIPIALMGGSFFLIFLNDLANFIEFEILTIVHTYIWTFAFAASLFMAYKKIEPMVFYLAIILFPFGGYSIFGLQFVQALEITAYIVTAGLFYSLLLHNEKYAKYSGIVGMSASIILVFNATTCIGCYSFVFPYALLALAFGLWLANLQIEHKIN